jgi:hypothetical protein
MNYLKTTIISLATTIIVLLVVYYFVPIWSVDKLGNEMLGVSVTEISGTDKMSAFPTIYNANLNALNNAKLEISDFNASTTLNQVTTMGNLSTVGTVATGTWNADILTVAYGGTGSSTLLSNGVLYGNGTDGVLAVPVGSDGQTLTLSSGVPVWSSGSVDESLVYNWTNYHDFTYIGMQTATATSLNADTLQIDGTTIDELKDGTSTALHLHPVRNGYFSTSTIANGTVQTVTHNLGVIPRHVRIYSFSAGDLGSGGATIPTWSDGQYNEFDGTITFDVYKDGNPNWGVGTQETNIISIDGVTNGTRDGVAAVISNLTPTTFDLTWSVSNNQGVTSVWTVQ